MKEKDGAIRINYFKGRLKVFGSEKLVEIPQFTIKSLNASPP